MFGSQRPPQLPETYENNDGESLPVVWERPGEVRIFAFAWRDVGEMVPMMRAGANAGQRQAETALKFFEPLADNDKVIYSVAVFLTKEATMQIPLGRIDLSFSDGTSARDQGAFFVERSKNQIRFRDSRNSDLKVQSKYATQPGQPIMVSFILPAEHLNKSVTGLRYVRDR